MRLLLTVVFLLVPLSAQNFSDYQVHRISMGHTFTEGPAWSHDGYLLFSDVPQAKIWKVVAGQESSQKTLFREDSGGANGNYLDRKGNLYTCEVHNRRLTRTDKKGRIAVLIDQWDGKRLNATNDVVVRKDGHIYFTDPAFGSREDTRELDFYGVFHLTGKGEAEVIARPKGRPNGIGLSPDGRILYVANTDERRLYAYDLDKDGSAHNERVLIDGIDGPPDGITVDENGNIYVTAGDLPVYSSGGKLLHTIEMPERATNCTFGDADLTTLYITARTSVYGIRLGVKGALQY